MSTKPAARGPMFEKLSQLRPQVSRNNQGRGNRGGFHDPVPSPMKWQADGVDHINIWEDGSTELGKALSHRYKLDFTNSVFGPFTTMEAFDRYVQSEERDDRLRRLTDKPLKNFAEKLTFRQVTNFKAINMDANYQRIKQYKPLVDEMIASTLPFDVYYVARDNGMRIRPPRHAWFIAGMEEIRKALKEGREPDFTFLLDKKKSKIYEFAIDPNMAKAAEAAKVAKQEPKREPAKSSLLSKVSEQEAAQRQAQEGGTGAAVASEPVVETPAPVVAQTPAAPAEPVARVDESVDSVALSPIEAAVQGEQLAQESAQPAVAG